MDSLCNFPKKIDCKCVDFVMSCQCERAETVPFNERQFLEDQGRVKKVIIRGIDLVETMRLQNKITRKESIETTQRQHSASTIESEM